MEKNKDYEESYLELEETLIPYPDSIDLAMDNNRAYMLRLMRPFKFEQQILLSRLTPYDNESYESIKKRLSEVVDWYHSTVYNYEDTILDKKNNLMKDSKDFLCGNIFQQLYCNMKSAKEYLFYTDLYLISHNKLYRYILSRNKFLFRRNIKKEILLNGIVDKDSMSDEADELIVLLAQPKRGSILYGEHAYQETLISAGALSQLIQFLASSVSDLKMRMHNVFYDTIFLQSFGIEDDNSIPVAVYEIHANQLEEEME